MHDPGEMTLAEVRRKAKAALLKQTAAAGFISPATIASVFELEERVIVALLERVGGEVHLPDFAAELASPPSKVLQAELADDGTYVLRVVDG